MLSTCISRGCTTIVFGTGTCTEHDGQEATVADQLLAEVVDRSRAEPETGPPRATPLPGRRVTE